jgi:hypothetical protein
MRSEGVSLTVSHERSHGFNLKPGIGIIGSTATRRFSVATSLDVPELAGAVVVVPTTVVEVTGAWVVVLSPPPKLVTPPGFCVLLVGAVVVVETVVGLTTGSSFNSTRIVSRGAARDRKTTAQSHTSGT